MRNDQRVIQTERLILRPFEDADTETYVKMMTDPLVTRYLGNGRNRTRADILHCIELFQSSWDQNQFGVWIVIRKDTGSVIGDCGFLPLENSDQVELLYAFSAEAWGKGYATEAARGAVDYAKQCYDWVRVAALTYPENQASIHVLEKLGFTYTGMKYFFERELNHYILDLRT